MAASLRKSLASKVLQSLAATNNSISGLSDSTLVNALRVKSAATQNTNLELQLPLLALAQNRKCSLNNRLSDLNLIGNALVSEFHTDQVFQSAYLTPIDSKYPAVNFNISSDHFAKGLLNEILRTPQNSYVSSKLFSLPREKIIVEFSSPNIAKPFHVGHLRSTIHGNFIANIMEAVGHDVTRLNYLGDWGTQFGLLQYGLDQGWHSLEDIAKNPIQLLLDIYVRANTLAEKDEQVAATARQLFQQLEKGDDVYLSKSWQDIRHYTVTELQRVYALLGVHFDEFHWESQYGIQHLKAVLEKLEQNGHLARMPDGRQFVKIPATEKSITLVKSDGSSLYLTRDLAAAIDRHDRFKFQKMFYVVDNAQTDHFVALKSLLSLMGHSWSESSIEHVKFGRIKGMSTRKGTVVLLSDILEEANRRMKSKQLESPTTKLDVEANPQVTGTLAVSALVIHDLKQRRQRDYTFQWDDALQDKGDTGIRLQYTHSRLCSLEKRCGVELCYSDAFDSVISQMHDPHLIGMIRDLARFHQVLHDCHQQLESCILVRYLFDLSHSVNVALKCLPVKNQPSDVAQGRLATFVAAKRVLSQGMKILGIEPLEEM